MSELGDLHASLREALTDDLRQRGTTEVAAMVVPACPAWTVKDVVAHLAGAEADILAGRLEGVGSDAWTAAQVDARRDRTLDEVLDEWSDTGPQVEAISGAFGPAEAQWVMDALTHDADVRGAIGLPIDRGSAGLDAALEFLVPGFVATVGEDAPEVRADGRTWAPPGGADATVEAPDRFELLRGLTGRRSAAQVAAWSWSAVPEDLAALLTWGPFRPREDDLAT